MIERVVDFRRLRNMRCRSCLHEWQVDADWLDRFHQADETCPACGTDCQAEDRPNFWVAREDPSYDDSTVRETYWYHTSTHANWPNRAFDPAAEFTEVTKLRMQRASSDGRGLERWVADQRTKALHLGTYEAAIENMLRRMDSQAGAEAQFYLYRVRLHRDVGIEPGVHPEPTNFVGDVQLEELCSPGADVSRHVNVHEDPSSISLAVGFGAMEAVQGIAIPLAVDAADPWVAAAAARLVDAASRPAPELQNALERMQRRMPSALSIEASRMEEEVAATLPLGLRRRFTAGSCQHPHSFPVKLVAMAQLVKDPSLVLGGLDAQPWREV